MYINIDKTKILIFHKGGRLNCEWVYNGNTIDVNTFNYLGIVLSSGGSIVHATQTLAGKVLRDLFDRDSVSILSYGYEVWGFPKSENIEGIHRKLIKWLLNLEPSTNSLYAEVGGIPLYICRYQRIIKYFLNIFYQESK